MILIFLLDWYFSLRFDMCFKYTYKCIFFHEQLFVDISIRNRVRFEGGNTFPFFPYFKDVDLIYIFWIYNNGPKNCPEIHTISGSIDISFVNLFDMESPIFKFFIIWITKYYIITIYSLKINSPWEKIVWIQVATRFNDSEKDGPD